MLDTTADVTEILTPAAREPEPTKAREVEATEDQDQPPRLRVGLLVLYTYPEGPHAGEERPAIITRVSGTFADYPNHVRCNLSVLLDGPNDSNTYDPKSSPMVEWRGSIAPGEGPNTFREFV
jgi:hypothetical protein